MVTVISFSSRKDGNCSKIARFLGENIKNSTGYSFADFSIEPCGKCDYGCFANRLDCPLILKIPKKFIVVSNTESDHFWEACFPNSFAPITSSCGSSFVC